MNEESEEKWETFDTSLELRAHELLIIKIIIWNKLHETSETKITSRNRWNRSVVFIKRIVEFIKNI